MNIDNSLKYIKTILLLSILAIVAYTVAVPEIISALFGESPMPTQTYGVYGVVAFIFLCVVIFSLMSTEKKETKWWKSIFEGVSVFYVIIATPAAIFLGGILYTAYEQGTIAYLFSGKVEGVGVLLYPVFFIISSLFLVAVVTVVRFFARLKRG